MDTYIKIAQQKIDKVLFLLLCSAPFWYTLLLFVEIEVVPYPKPPRLDGKTLSFTGDYWRSFSTQQTASLLAFAVGQAMLLHPSLRGLSCLSGADVATEIALSHILSLAPLHAPKHDAHDPSLSGLPPTQIYNILYNQEMPQDRKSVV